MLEVENLTAAYGNGQRVLDGVSFALEPGHFTAVLGQNGCGKSTLVACINRELHYGGKILLDGMDIAELPPRERALKTAILPQMLSSPHVTAEELVMFGRSPHMGAFGRRSEEDTAAVERAIADAGVESLRKKMVDGLSGGERQKVYLAMVLAQDCPLLVLDEPTTYMDITYERWFLEKLAALRGRGRTLLVIMHNLAQAVRYADDIVVLKAGKVRFCGSRDESLAQKIIEEVFSVSRHEVDGEDGERLIFFT